MIDALSYIILEIPIIIAKAIITNQNSCLFFASLRDTLFPFFERNLSISLGLAKILFFSYPYINEIETNGINKLTESIITKNLEPHTVLIAKVINSRKTIARYPACIMI